MVFLFSYCDEFSAAGLPDGSGNFAQIQTDLFLICNPFCCKGVEVDAK